jgi:hypothetical protein
MTVCGEIAEPRRETRARSRVRGRTYLKQSVDRPRSEPSGRRLVVAADWQLEQKLNHLGKVLPDVYR